MNCNHLSFLWKLLLALAAVVLAVNFYQDIILHGRPDAFTRYLFPVLLFSSLIVQVASRRCRKKQSG
ncbi:hypothetical protein L21_0627 [Methanoculleus chikugoensis]|jgi:hypothetical protein|uniref:Uncharacterized protein n=1 Tax=Methanoculleus chikugoensis TaxID=118126 RepID=A0A1M4MIK0_9EURY|nr:hypothetical protein [Methanoculleus chikugoensis]MDD4568181.1 hypothetical protein [Methanoculleus chikugoensis]NMA09938.1 hypothetical protein [Methanomicrobiales archaeon]SCL74744.1 hypothetical protein L21_0627 [Methanoculleus chikugoensis]